MNVTRTFKNEREIKNKKEKKTLRTNIDDEIELTNESFSDSLLELCW